MNRSMIAVSISLLATILCLPATISHASDLEEIRQLEERLNALEQEAAALRSDLAVIKSSVSSDPEYSSAQNTPTLLGTWECTNNVFTYELSLMQNSTVITKEMSSGKTRQGKWTKRGKDDIVISNPGYRSGGSAQSFRVIDLSEDRMSLEEPNTQSIYDCIKLSQE